MRTPIYFDYAATTPVDPRVAQVMMSYLTEKFGNPASNSHSFGWEASAAVEKARKEVAALIHADASEIVWTSGATESNNLAIKGVAQFYQSRGRHLITMTTEHKSVLDTMHEMETQGYEVTYLSPDKNGLLRLNDLEAAVRHDTILVSVMAVNNEIGVIQPIEAIGKLCKERDIVFHVDAAQAAGKIPLDVMAQEIDLMSLSAHKMYGPKGIGSLYVRRSPRVELKIQMHGGGHESGRRSGTLPTHQIVGMGEACRIAREESLAEEDHIRNLSKYLITELTSLPHIHINGDLEKRVPHNLNFYFYSERGAFSSESLFDIAVSAGSACSSASAAPSYVLTELGCPATPAGNAIRLSIGRYTTQEEVEFAVKHIRSAVLDYYQ